MRDPGGSGRFRGDPALGSAEAGLPSDRAAFAHGIPSHDTLNDGLNALDPSLFSDCFVGWVEALREREPDIVAIDGKSSRRARAKGGHPLHVVSAWATRQRLVLWDRRRWPKSQRDRRAPASAGTPASHRRPGDHRRHGPQTAIAPAILDKGADYRRALKDNGPPLAEDGRLVFADPGTALRDTHETRDLDHGRSEIRRPVVYHDDLMRLRTDSGPQNMATIKHMAMNLIRAASGKDSLKARRKAAAWNHDGLRAIVTQTA